jgi:hypothetical protein
MVSESIPDVLALLHRPNELVLKNMHVTVILNAGTAE